MTKVKSTGIIKIYNKLDEVLEKAEEGFVRYKSGWSDKHIAETLDVPLATVSRVRNENFGRVKNSPGKGRDSIIRRLDMLEARVAELEEALTK